MYTVQNEREGVEAVTNAPIHKRERLQARESVHDVTDDLVAHIRSLSAKLKPFKFRSFERFSEEGNKVQNSKNLTFH